MERRDTPATTRCNVQVEFGRAALSAKRASSLRAGTVLELDAFADDYVDVYADGQLVARGRPVIADGKLGVRIQESLIGGMTACAVPWVTSDAK